MTGSIPEEEDEEQETYDDVGNVADVMDEIYEVLPGSTTCCIGLYHVSWSELPVQTAHTPP